MIIVTHLSNFDALPKTSSSIKQWVSECILEILFQFYKNLSRIGTYHYETHKKGKIFIHNGSYIQVLIPLQKQNYPKPGTSFSSSWVTQDSILAELCWDAHKLSNILTWGKLSYSFLTRNTKCCPSLPWMIRSYWQVHNPSKLKHKLDC